MTDLEIVWLAGLLEGEGSFMKGPPSSPNLPIISIKMTDEDIISKVANLFGNAYCAYAMREIHHKPCFGVKLVGSKAILLMQELLPYMGIRRSQQIREAINSYKVKEKVPPLKLSMDQVQEIKNYRSQGYSTRRLAEMYGLHHTNIARCLKRAMKVER